MNQFLSKSLKCFSIISSVLLMSIMISQPVHAAVYMEEVVSVNGKSTEYDLGQIDHIYMTASTSAFTSLSSANGTSLPKGSVSTGTVTLGVYQSNGTLIISRSCSGNNGYSWNIDLSSVTGNGYFQVSASQGGQVAYVVQGNGNYGYTRGQYSYSDITIYRLPSPQISGTNLAK